MFGAFLKAAACSRARDPARWTLAYGPPGGSSATSNSTSIPGTASARSRVAEGAGLTVSDFLAGTASAGNPLVVGGDVSYGKLATILAENT